MNRWRWWKARPQMLQAPCRPVASESLLLLSGLEVQAMQERQAGKADVLGPVVRDAMRANHIVVAKTVANLAEELRLTATAVVINSLDKGRPPPGRTWLEWDGAVEGRLPCSASNRVRYDRVGVLVEADETGERGIIHVLIRVAPDQVRQSGVVGLLPVAYTYDLRDAWERPASLMEAASVQDVRREHKKAANPSLAEREGSPVILAALGRRFGVVESPYLEAAFRQKDGLRTSFWYLDSPELFVTAVQETTPDILLAIFMFILMRTTEVDAVTVPRGPPSKEATHGVAGTELPYVILELAVPLYSGWRRSNGPTHQGGKGR